MSESGGHKLMWVLGILLVASVAGMIVAGSQIFGFDPTRAAAGPAATLIGAAAPPLDLPVVAGDGAAEHDRVSLASLRGKPVLLDFWASWCGPCRRSIPALNQVHERYGRRVAFWGVNVEGGLPRAHVQAAHRDFGARFPSLLDERGEAQAMYRVSSIPTLVLIDGAGTVRWVFTGVPDPDQVAARIDALLDSEAPQH